MENAGIFYGHMEYFAIIWYILWPFGTVVVIWYIFHRSGILCQEKSGNPGLAAGSFITISCDKVSTYAQVIGDETDLSSTKDPFVGFGVLPTPERALSPG
jgi:hypothetical protein